MEVEQGTFTPLVFTTTNSAKVTITGKCRVQWGTIPRVHISRRLIFILMAQREMNHGMINCILVFANGTIVRKYINILPLLILSCH